MGAYRSKPITKKVCEAGNCNIGKRKVIYGASAMQGWRLSMEDAHSIVPDFDQNSSLFGVYDGHGGREVAVYCATHLADIIKSTAAYGQGDLGKAMKDAFMQCDRLLKEKEAIAEMKKYDEDEISEEEKNVESKEDLAALVEESSMPLQDLLSRYGGAPAAAASDDNKGSDFKSKGLSSLLELLTRIPDDDFEDSDSDSDVESASSSDESGEGCETIESPSPAPALDATNTKLCSSGSETLDKTNVEIKQDPQSDSLQTETNSELINASTSQGPSQLLTGADGQTETNSNTSTLESGNDVPLKITRLDSKSLKDLLTSQPDGKSLSTRKRLHPNSEDDSCGSVPKKSNPGPMSVDKQGYHSGTTAVVGILRDSDFIVANAGDSKCVLGSRGVAVDMSFDHKPTDPIELERITTAGGHVGVDNRVNGGLNLSRAIGDHFYKSNESLPLESQMISAMPDIKSVPINNDQDFIVFACDGIWNSKTSQEVVDFVCHRLKEKVGNRLPTQQDLTQICDSLCDSCLAADTDNDGTGCDNMTCILIYFVKNT